MDRIRRARCLAFGHAEPDGLVAVAALKAPGAYDRARIFERADAGVDAAEWENELGWVFVAPAFRRRGAAVTLCDRLMEHADGGLFATTRPRNLPMIRILRGLGFDPVGVPYRRGEETLALFLRPDPDLLPG